MHDINMVLDIPVQLSVELGRTKVPIKHILQLGQGSVVELDALAGEVEDWRGEKKASSVKGNEQRVIFWALDFEESPEERERLWDMPRSYTSRRERHEGKVCVGCRAWRTAM